jgi:hypothetical protein
MRWGSAPYTFANPPSGPLASTLVAVVNTKRPVMHPANRPVVPPSGNAVTHPIRRFLTNIGGVLIPPPQTARTDKITPVDPDMKRTDNQDALTEKAAWSRRNECAPAAVANSMEYLKVTMLRTLKYR